MNVQEFKLYLKKADKLLANANNWCRYSMAKDKDGNIVSVFEKGACRWCLGGALSKSIGSVIYLKEFDKYFATALCRLGLISKYNSVGNTIICVNDNSDYITLKDIVRRVLELDDESFSLYSSASR